MRCTPPFKFTKLGPAITSNPHQQLLIIQNLVKHDSSRAFSVICGGGIECKIITGDNAFTAVKIAREIQMNSNSKSKIERFIIGDTHPDGTSGIIWRDYDTDSQIPEEDIAGCVATSLTHMQAVCNDLCPPPLPFALCITGSALTLLENPILSANLAPTLDSLNVVPAISIFARVSPAQKAQIVSDIEEFGAVVGMCGDGGNDVSALRQATFGFALSECWGGGWLRVVMQTFLNLLCVFVQFCFCSFVSAICLLQFCFCKTDSVIAAKRML